MSYAFLLLTPSYIGPIYFHCKCLITSCLGLFKENKGQVEITFVVMNVMP